LPEVETLHVTSLLVRVINFGGIKNVGRDLVFFNHDIEQ
jgi:hypothetical protein